MTRRVEAIVFDCDGTALPDRDAGAARQVRLIEEACAAGIELAIVSGTDIADLDGRLPARPAGPGGLLVLAGRGAEAYQIDEHGPRLLARIIDGSAPASWIIRWLWQRGIAADQVLGSASRGGGLETLAALLEDQIARRADGELPMLAARPHVDAVDRGCRSAARARARVSADPGRRPPRHARERAGRTTGECIRRC